MVGASHPTAPSGAQLEQELRGVDDVGGIGRQREEHQAARVEPAEGEGGEIGAVQGQHEHAEHVFPEEDGREQVAAEHRFLPDRASDHDRIERDRLRDDGGCRGHLARAGGEIPQDEGEADEKDRELQGREDGLNEGPWRPIALAPLLRCVERLCLGARWPTFAHERFSLLAAPATRRWRGLNQEKFRPSFGHMSI